MKYLTKCLNGSLAGCTLRDDHVPEQCDMYSLYGPDDHVCEQNIDPQDTLFMEPNFDAPGDTPRNGKNSLGKNSWSRILQSRNFQGG